jgi:hypothetical protein
MARKIITAEKPFVAGDIARDRTYEHVHAR